MNKDIGIQIRTIKNLIGRGFEKSTMGKQLENITGTNTWLIAYIAEQTENGNEVYQRDIEERFGITRSTVSKVVSLLEQKGLIERSAVAKDARLKRLSLTPVSAALASEMKADSVRFEKRLTAGFSPEELRQLQSYLDRIQKNLE